VTMKLPGKNKAPSRNLEPQFRPLEENLQDFADKYGYDSMLHRVTPEQQQQKLEIFVPFAREVITSAQDFGFIGYHGKLFERNGGAFGDSWMVAAIGSDITDRDIAEVLTHKVPVPYHLNLAISGFGHNVSLQPTVSMYTEPLEEFLQAVNDSLGNASSSSVQTQQLAHFRERLEQGNRAMKPELNQPSVFTLNYVTQSQSTTRGHHIDTMFTLIMPGEIGAVVQEAIVTDPQIIEAIHSEAIAQAEQALRQGNVQDGFIFPKLNGTRDQTQMYKPSNVPLKNVVILSRG
jgi:hypothetical protein